MLVSVKMKTTKKMMVSVLLVLAVLSVGITPIFAAPDKAMSRGAENAQRGQQNKFTTMNARGLTIREQVKQRLQAMNTPLNITDLDEAGIDAKFAEVEAATPVNDTEGSVIWYLNARGMSTPLAPVTDAENPATPVGIQLLAEKVKTTEYGKLYKVLWGRVNHNGEKVTVEGYAILDSDGVFYMKLNGENLSFKTIGRIAPAGIGVRVAMKGYMTHDDVDCSVQMHGRAIPLRGNMIRNRLGHQKGDNDVEPSGSRRGNTVTPYAEPA
jgi:hypothetical protein